MSVVINQSWNALTPESYDKLREVVRWDTDRPDGMQLHVATFGDDGVLRMTDVFDSAESFNQFVHQRIVPGLEQSGVKGFPEVTVGPVHEYI